MRANRRATQRIRAEDSGQLLILAGVILVMAFMMSVLTVHELASQQQRTLQGPQSPLPDVFRQVRDRVAGTLSGLTYAGIDNGTFLLQVNATQQDAQRLSDRHAAQLVLRLADANDTFAPRNEQAFTSTVSGRDKYVGMWSYNGSRDYSTVFYDGVPDGIVWDGNGCGGKGCITGAVLFVMLSDPSSRIQETVVVAVN